MAVPRGQRGTRRNPQAQKTLPHPLVFHAKNQFSRVFPRSGLASPVSLFIFPWLPAASWPNPPHPHRLLHLGLLSRLKWEGSWDGMGQEAGSRKYPHPVVWMQRPTDPPCILAFTS